MQTQYEMSTEFHRKFRLTAPDKPTQLTETQVINRSSWLIEEILELIHATAGSKEKFSSMCEEVVNRMEQTYYKQREKEFPEDVLVAQADACTDIQFFSNGNFTEMAIDPQPLYEIVFNSNMSKLFDGEPRYNEVGKVIKSPDFIPPEPLLAEEIQRQLSA